MVRTWSGNPSNPCRPTMKSPRSVSVTWLVTERVEEAPKTAMRETRVSPIMRADAVAAVRRG